MHLDGIVNHSVLIPDFSIALLAVVFESNVIYHLEELVQWVEGDVSAPVPREPVLIYD